MYFVSWCDETRKRNIHLNNNNNDDNNNIHASREITKSLFCFILRKILKFKYSVFYFLLNLSRCYSEITFFPTRLSYG